MNSKGSFKPPHSSTFSAPYRRCLHPLAVEVGEGSKPAAGVDAQPDGPPQGLCANLLAGLSGA